MLVVFSPIFMADANIIFRYDFVAPLNSAKTSKLDSNLFFNLVVWILSAGCPRNSVILFWYIFADSVSLKTTSTVLAVCFINEASSVSTKYNTVFFQYHCNLCRTVADLLYSKEHWSFIHCIIHCIQCYHIPII